MARRWNNSRPDRWLGYETGQWVRCWVAGFLRVGIGVSLLGIGLAGYFGQKHGIPRGSFLGQPSGVAWLEPFYQSAPYLEIALGLALIVGFMTTVVAIGSAFFSLLNQVVAIISVISALGNAGTQFTNGYFNIDSFMITMLSSHLISLIPYAALIWLSPLENHPISIDALMFGPNENHSTDTPEPESEGRPEPSGRER